MTLARQRQLAQRQLVSRQDLDTAATDLAVKQAQIGTIEAQIKRNQATLDTAKTNLDYTRILAPMAGEVTQITHPAGTDGDRRPAGAEHSDAGGSQHYAGQSAGL